MQQIHFDLSQVTGSVAMIPAAGIGKRFGGKVAKQYLDINGEIILDITLKRFISSPRVEKVVLIVSPHDSQFETLDSILDEKIILIEGGDERHLSVNNGLRYLYDNGLPDNIPVLVHDAARPCLTERDLDALLDYFDTNKKACFLAEPVADSLKKINLDQQVINGVERENIVHALTPQLASFIDLKNALSKVIKSDIYVTDEVGALTSCDLDVYAIFAQDLNPKITHKKDLALAEQILSSNKN